MILLVCIGINITGIIVIGYQMFDESVPNDIKIMVNRELHIKLAGYDTFIGTEWRVIDHDDVVYSCFNDYDAALKEYRKLESKKMANAN